MGEQRIRENHGGAVGIGELAWHIHDEKWQSLRMGEDAGLEIKFCGLLSECRSDSLPDRINALTHEGVFDNGTTERMDGSPRLPERDDDSERADTDRTRVRATRCRDQGLDSSATGVCSGASHSRSSPAFALPS